MRVARRTQPSFISSSCCPYSRRCCCHCCLDMSKRRVFLIPYMQLAVLNRHRSIYKHRTYLYEARDASRMTVSSTRLSLAALTPVAAAATTIFTCRGIVVNRVFHSSRYWRWPCPFAVCRLSRPRCVLVPYMQLVKVNCYFIIKEEEKDTDTRFETRRSRALIISSLLYSYSFYG